MSQVGASDGDAGPSYHRLTVAAVREETADARSFVLVPESGDEALYCYTPGQFLTFRVPHDSGELIRSYSLSSAPCSDPAMTVCVKRVAGGRGSNWFHDHLSVGESIDATRPSGSFVSRNGGGPLLLIAGGSGITPCISLVKQAMVETGLRVKLVYANQNAAAVIYRGMLDNLEGHYGGRFTCQHWLDDDSGFLTPADIVEAAKGWAQADCYICGPDPLMDMAEETLSDLLGPDATVLTERFVSPDDPVRNRDAVSPPPATLIERFRLTLDGEDHTVPIAPGETLLEAAQAAEIDAPCSCTEGHCGTCMSWLRSGDVTMTSTQALSKRNIERGWILACQSRPSSDTPIWLDFDI